MTLLHILVFSALALVFCVLEGRSFMARWRGGLLLAASLIAPFWLQPSTPIRSLDFWLPTASILLTGLVWFITRPPSRPLRADLPAVLLGTGVILGVGLTRYLGPLCCLTPTRPPELLRIGLALALAGALMLGAMRLPRKTALAALGIWVLIGLFIALKWEPLARAVSSGMRLAAGQDPQLAEALDLRWLGFSYLAFRLIHCLRDFQAGKLPELGLAEFATYALFFPAFTAGPIDRSQRFVNDLRSPAGDLAGRLTGGSRRIFIGAFKKFVLADTLALVALNQQNALQTTSPLWMWLLVYAYALRIYFDFSGYTDVALGLGRLLGIQLPENFDHPYHRTNLTSFWNSWHITLAQWFRAYFFNPVTRALRTRPQKLPAWVVILIGQTGTMLLIGLWHGLTWNFVAWGVWHAAGLFVHNRWADWTRAYWAEKTLQPPAALALQAGGWFLTFHYVALGWVLFALPSLGLSGRVFEVLLGGPVW